MCPGQTRIIERNLLVPQFQMLSAIGTRILFKAPLLGSDGVTAAQSMQHITPAKQLL